MTNQLDPPGAEAPSRAVAANGTEALRIPVERLAARVRALPALEGDASDSDIPKGARDELLTLLSTKLLPECGATALPLFVAIQGGGNVGKSTIVNALAGRLISPAAVQASSTCHPLVYAHEKWHEAFLGQTCFTEFECRELSDPRELLGDKERSDVFYFAFHTDDRLAGIALIDSPDLDSFVGQNVAGAIQIGTVGDITVFVTTAQKYKDKILVEHLTRLLSSTAAALVLFNQVNEEIVFETLLSDLKNALPSDVALTYTTRIPTIFSPHPEEQIGESLRNELLPMFDSFDAVDVKRKTLGSALSSASRLAKETLNQLRQAAETQRKIVASIETGAADCVREYEASSGLAFPEETIALKKALKFTELGSLLQRTASIEETSRPLALVGSAVRNVNRVLRRVVLQLNGKHEGIVEGSEENLKNYAKVRDKADSENAVRCVESLRTKIESDLRGHHSASPIARGLLTDHLTPQYARSFGDNFREIHLQHLRETPNTGADLLPRLDAWLRAREKRARALGVAAVVLKVILALVIAAALPPEKEVFLGLLNIVKWAYFIGGYLIASYLVAAAIALFLPGKRHFIAGRRKAFATTVKKLLTEPLRTAMEGYVREKDCQEMETTLQEFETAAIKLTSNDTRESQRKEGVKKP